MPDQYTMSSQSPGIPEARATPPKYPMALSASETVSAIHDFVSKPFGFDNPPGRMLSEFLGLPDVAKTLEHVGYGERLTEGQGMQLRIPDETLGAIGALPFGMPGKAAKAGKVAHFAEKTATEALNPEIKLLHSSPHKFDEFDATHIGTGEGAQVYGQGLYFTDSYGVHKYYNESFKNRAKHTSLDDYNDFLLDGKRSKLRQVHYWDTSDPERVALSKLGEARTGTIKGAKAELNKYLKQEQQDLSDVLEERAWLTPRHWSEEERAAARAEKIKQTQTNIRTLDGAIKWFDANAHRLVLSKPGGDVIFNGHKMLGWGEGRHPNFAQSSTEGRVLANLNNDLQRGTRKYRESPDSLKSDYYTKKSEAIKLAERYLEADKKLLENPNYDFTDEEIRALPQLATTATLRRTLGGTFYKQDLKVHAEYVARQEKDLEKSRAELAWFNGNRDQIQIDVSKAFEIPERPAPQRYVTEFPDKHLNKLMDYDKPYSHQTPYVRRALQKALGKTDAELEIVDRTGAEMYNDFAATRGKLQASMDLRNVGIPGHKYDTAGSRGPDRDGRHHNYVIYPGAEKKHLKILKREDIR